MNLGRKSLESGSDKRERKRERSGKRAALFIIRSVIAFLIILIAGIAVFSWLYVKRLINKLPDASTIDISPTGYSTTILDSDGNNIQTLAAAGSNRKYVSLDEIPKNVQNAFIAIEDSRFWKHNGVDVKGIFRAAVTKLTSHGRMQGASTITQQLLKNNYFTTWTEEKTFKDSIERKIQEQYLAVQLEKITSKKRILENYLNTINLGQNTLGVESASERYFNKNVSDLNLSEAAVIAAITQNPSRYNPITNPDENAKRRESVLSKMLKQGLITKAEYDEAENDDVYSRITATNNAAVINQNNSYFVDALTDEVANDLISEKGYTDTQAYQLLYSGGLTIYSTQNTKMQSIMDEEINNPDNYSSGVKYSFSYRLSVKKQDGTFKNYSEQTMLKYYKQFHSGYTINFNSEEEARAAIEKYKSDIMEPGDIIPEGGESLIITLQPQIAMTLIDHTTGKVLAISGGRGEKNASKTLNRATGITRQPGSTFKILSTYAPALDSAGLTLASVQDDAPYSYSGANGKQVANWDNKYNGFTTLHQGIVHSMNIVTIKTLAQIGTGLGFQYVQDFGISTLASGDNNQALAIGGIANGVTNLELTDAYATIADSGLYHKSIFYTKVTDHDGNVILDNTETMKTTKKVLKPATAWLLTTAMKDVMTSPIGTGKSANPSNAIVAGKTGTTNDDRDHIMEGYSAYYTLGAWGGYDDNTTLRNGAYVNLIWKKVMERLHEGLESKDFAMPDNIVQVEVCKKSGKRAIPGVCDADPRGNMVYTEYFQKGTEPSESDTCDHHVKVSICSASGLPSGPYCPGDQVQEKVFITGGSPGTDDEPYEISDDTLKQTCNIHTSPANPAPAEGTGTAGTNNTEASGTGNTASENTGDTNKKTNSP